VRSGEKKLKGGCGSGGAKRKERRSNHDFSCSAVGDDIRVLGKEKAHAYS
jgi:hypothetical protein